MPSGEKRGQLKCEKCLQVKMQGKEQQPGTPDHIQTLCGSNPGAQPGRIARAAGWSVTHCMPGCCLDKYTAEEKPGTSPREKAPLLSDKAVQTPKERTIGNESWTEN